ncbi:MAG: HAD hydrolase-like protein [Polyangiaceae bacterium]
MLPPAAVVFDLDGTLVDSRGDIVAAVNHALLATGRAALPGPVIVQYIGDGARALCARAARVPESSEEVDVLLADFLAYYVEHPIDFTRWMAGAQEALDELATMSMPLGICTNKPRATTEAVLGALGIRTRFRGIVAGGDMLEKKPAPAPLLGVAKQLGVPPELCVMVGDLPQDAWRAPRGHALHRHRERLGPRERLLESRPDVTLASLLEVPDVIRRWRDATTRVASPGRTG